MITVFLLQLCSHLKSSLFVSAAGSYSRLFYWISFAYIFTLFVSVQCYLKLLSSFFTLRLTTLIVVLMYKKLLITSLLLWDAAPTQRQTWQRMCSYLSWSGRKPKISWDFCAFHFSFLLLSQSTLFSNHMRALHAGSECFIFHRLGVGDIGERFLTFSMCMDNISDGNVCFCLIQQTNIWHNTYFIIYWYKKHKWN